MEMEKPEQKRRSRQWREQAMWFFKEKEDLISEITRLQQQVDDLSHKMEQYSADHKKLDTLIQENQQLKQEQETLRLKHWHMGYEYDHLFSCIQLNEIEKKVPGNRKRLEGLKDKYAGKRCFLVGNGPSLQFEDLEQIKGEISFACNRIAEAYRNTAWRPDYYLCTDTLAFADKVSQLVENEKNILLPIDFQHYMGTYGNRVFYPLFRRYSIVPEFSADPVHGGVYDGGTVLYSAAQFAVYMGFQQIVLLGVDADYPMVEMEDGKKVIDWKVNSHFYENTQEDIVSIKKFGLWGNYNDTVHSGLYDLTAGWNMLHYQSKQLGFEVINASRGGKLEVFPRMRLEDVLAKDRSSADRKVEGIQ